METKKWCSKHKIARETDESCYWCTEEDIARAEAGQIKSFYRNSGNW